MIELEFYIPLPPDLAWEKLVQDPHMRKWWSKDAALEAVKGGRFADTWVDKTGKSRLASGSVTAVDPARRIQLDYRRHDWPRATRVEIMLSPEKPGSRLYLQHSGWDAIPDEVERIEEVDAYTKSWQKLMENFAKYCAG